jgi:hypothetical protein
VGGLHKQMSVRHKGHATTATRQRGLGVAAARDGLSLVAMGAAGVQAHVGMWALMQTHPSSSSITCNSA